LAKDISLGKRINGTCISSLLPQRSLVIWEEVAQKIFDSMKEVKIVFVVSLGDLSSPCRFYFPIPTHPSISVRRGGAEG
jgi:hypothetical protein